MSATATTLSIASGPNRDELILNGLRDGLPQQFTFEELGPRQVRVTSVQREDGSSQSWNITGHILGTNGPGRYTSFKGYYRTDRRQGTYQTQ